MTEEQAGTISELAAAMAAISGSSTDSGTPARERRAPSGSHSDTAEEVDAASGVSAEAATEIARAKNICLRLLAARQRSRMELATTLQRREVSSDTAEQVLDRLDAVGLIDDAAFAAAFVADQRRNRGLGRRVLRLELRRKGISDDLAQAALNSVDDDAERLQAEQLVARRLRGSTETNTTALRRRLLAMLARRGYPADLAQAVVSTALAASQDVSAGPNSST